MAGAMGSDQFTRLEIEAGRTLFASDWQFVAAAGSPASLPPMKGVEIAFAGRSNVGKSSLINALTGRKNLARISRTPGRTQELIFFSAATPQRCGHARLRLCRRGKIQGRGLDGIDRRLSARAEQPRPGLCTGDARHGLKPTDGPALDALGQAAVSHQIVLTKCDELKPADLASRIADVEAALTKRRAAFPTVLATSSHDGAGIPELRAAIARLLVERKR